MDQLRQTVDELWQYLPHLLGGIAVLVVGVLVAWIAAGVTRRLVARTRVDDHLERVMGKRSGKAGPLARGVAIAVFWIIVSLAVIGALSIMQLPVLSESLQQAVDSVLRYLPHLIAAGILLLVAWVVASVLRWIIVRALATVNFERWLGTPGDSSAPEMAEPATDAAPRQEHALSSAPRDVAQSIGEIVYWLVLLLFLPAILGALELRGILEPVQGMVDKVLLFLPNVLVAVIILAVGWFFAGVLRRIVTGILAAAGADRLGSQIGLKAEGGREGSISHIAGWTVFLLVLIPVFLAALDALRLQSITAPVSEMLTRLLNAVPYIFAAGLVLVIAYLAGRILSQLVTKLLESSQFDALPAKLGFGEMAIESQWAPSRLAGHLVLVAILLFAAATSLELLGFEIVAGMLTTFLHLAGRILLGLAIFALGLFLARIVSGAITSRQMEHARVLALTARIAILLLAGAMALRQMGLADEIITLAFGLTFGAVAVAAAIAFGIGGRDVAARKLEEWEKDLRHDRDEPK